MLLQKKQHMSSSSSSRNDDDSDSVGSVDRKEHWAARLQIWDETLSEGTRGDHTYTWFDCEVILDADLFDVNKHGSFSYHGDAEGLADAIYDYVAAGWRFKEGGEGFRMCASCKDAIMEMFRRHGFAIRLREDPSPQYHAGDYYFVVDGWSDPRQKNKKKRRKAPTDDAPPDAPDDAPPPPPQLPKKTARDEVEEFVEGHSGLSPGAKAALRAAIRACNVCE